MTTHLLVVEDEKDLQRVLAYNLKQAGFDVVVAGDGDTALRALREETFDLILLDLMLPGSMSGNEVCRRIRQTPATANVPVVMITAKGEEVDRVVGFELGADDYVVKPFSVRELILRVQAILRRGAGPASEDRTQFGVLRIDRAAHRVFAGDEEVSLTALEFKLLIALFDRKGRVLSRDALLDDVWGAHVDVTRRNVDTHVKRLREKLGPAGPYLETVRGVGYRFRDAPGES